MHVINVISPLAKHSRALFSTLVAHLRSSQNAHSELHTVILRKRISSIFRAFRFLPLSHSPAQSAAFHNFHLCSPLSLRSASNVSALFPFSRSKCAPLHLQRGSNGTSLVLVRPIGRRAQLPVMPPSKMSMECFWNASASSGHCCTDGVANLMSIVGGIRFVSMRRQMGGGA